MQLGFELAYCVPGRLNGAKCNAETVPVMLRATVWDDQQGANHSHSKSYGEDLQRSWAPDVGMRGARGDLFSVALGRLDPLADGRWTRKPQALRAAA